MRAELRTAEMRAAELERPTPSDLRVPGWAVASIVTVGLAIAGIGLQAAASFAALAQETRGLSERLDHLDARISRIESRLLLLPSPENTP